MEDQNRDLKSPTFAVTTFYKFFQIEDPGALQTTLEEAAQKLDIQGLIIIGHEGINSTLSSANPESLEQFKNFIRKLTVDPQLFFKDSVSNVAPFRRFKVKIRTEIVTLGTPELIPSKASNHHLSPREWNQVLKEESDFVLIDTRNWYETKIGTFVGAVNPMTDKFTEFPEFMEMNNFAKDKKTLIFCTGGIRCEKGILELQRRGYENVFQLEGGILNYLKEYPNDQFAGECFVFDHRVALDQQLKPSQIYHLCPHCGQPGKLKIDCKRCEATAYICEDCEKLDFKKDTCSKNCAHHYELNPAKKGPQQTQSFSTQPR